MTQTRLTLLECLRELRDRLEKRHEACIPAAEVARCAHADASRQAASGSLGSSSCSTTTAAGADAFQAMMQLESARKEASEANAVALAAEKRRDAAEAAVAELERVLHPKRVRTEATDQGEDGLTKAANDWDLADHWREATRVMNRRSIKPVSESMARALRTGKDGFLEHSRLWLIGAVAYWAWGSMALAVTIIVALIMKLDIP
uniref:Uncharacterized protein n=1 Tax=Coccolithus braarudii TaxID=221442 RepID=A0A7S0Q5E5_9EUKA|mmetsp:Transcript_36521/g.77909  ORF Transcript_36521/g.77909 Transcript_36521/m.77909 type:complete len:204 (+) Transcript_36521:152-763(+)